MIFFDLHRFFSSATDEADMARLMKQVSIESPTHKLKECIFNFDEPMPEVPDLGARVKVSLNIDFVSIIFFKHDRIYVIVLFKVILLIVGFKGHKRGKFLWSHLKLTMKLTLSHLLG